MKASPQLRPRLKREIDAITDKILRELGYPEPPLKLEGVRELLKLDLAYFSTEQDGLFRSTVSRLKRAGKQLLSRPGLLGDAIKKFDLRALYLPDQRRVLIDDGTPVPKHRWLEAHEIGHDLLPWHREMMLGDDESTVSTSAHAKIEAEANYTAGGLLFMGNRFREECRSLESPTIEKIKALKKAYGNTMTTTFWRVIDYAGEDKPILGFIGNHPTAGPGATTMFRHLILSPAFLRLFPSPAIAEIENEIRHYCGWRKKGPLGQGAIMLRDHDGKRHEFSFESFFNGYDALTLGVWKCEAPTVIAFP